MMLILIGWNGVECNYHSQLHMWSENQTSRGRRLLLIGYFFNTSRWHNVLLYEYSKYRTIKQLIEFPRNFFKLNYYQ